MSGKWSKVVLASVIGSVIVGGYLPVNADAASTSIKSSVTKKAVAPYNYAKYRTDMERKVYKLKYDISKRSHYFDGPVREVFDHDTHVEDAVITSSFKELSSMIAKYRSVMGDQYKTVTALSKTLSKVNTKTERLAFDAAYAKVSSRATEKKYADRVLVKGEDINNYILEQQDESVELYRKNQESLADPFVDILNVNKLVASGLKKSVAANSKLYVDKLVKGGMKKVDAEKRSSEISKRFNIINFVGYVYKNDNYDVLMEKIYARDFDYVNKNRDKFESIVSDAIVMMDEDVKNRFK